MAPALSDRNDDSDKSGTISLFPQRKAGARESRRLYGRYLSSYLSAFPVRIECRMMDPCHHTASNPTLIYLNVQTLVS
ncbi:hypothetical protein HMPREF0620_0532 [Parascardovia denticolens DSM 10105 = JCM 12538]|uniref:Uncharacterized protein n=1 Tax=Parascardovia denticolens DSM 10105 = JCM 12538 TaxID=864564 RepID=E6K146_PARDN|nr:hypothetical protein HMPREF0620_0532 [Parascardovia denticolens DSM 10105 = JCM 12538]